MMARFLKAQLLIVAALCIAAAAAQLYSRAVEKTSAEHCAAAALPTRIQGNPVEIDAGRLTAAIHQSAAYLHRATTRSGRFVYRVNLDPTVTPKRKYNILRHAGAVYSLAKYYHVYPNAATRQALASSVGFLRKSMAVVPDEDGIVAVWSKPEVNGRDAPLQAKLGGAGLALAALLSAEESGALSSHIEELRGLGRFLLFMQKADGGFFAKYIPDHGGRDDSWKSLYYPGEAALGLTMLYERDSQLKWLQAAVDAITYLARTRRGQTQVEADHWAIIATARLLSLNDPRVPRESLLEHADQICESILSDGCRLNDLDATGFMADGRTCPTATRLEGLLAALSFLGEDEPIRRSIKLAIGPALNFLLRSQVQSGPYAGGIPRARRRLPAGHPMATASFNERAAEIRVDYVQHALCAMLEYQIAIRPSPQTTGIPCRRQQAPTVARYQQG